jgi:Zn-dependent protease
LDIASILRQLAISAAPLLIAITFHEVAHGLAAYRMGDGTAKASGRLTLNPMAHIDPVGTVLMPLLLLALSGGQFVFGYAKPVPINPYNFRNPRRDMALSAAAGPGMNVALAVAFLLLLKMVLVLSGVLPRSIWVPLSLMLESGIFVNVFLAAINLMPVPPLDGGRIVTGFLPPSQAAAFARLEPYGMIIAIVLLMTGLYRVFVNPVVNLLLYFLNLLSGLL